MNTIKNTTKAYVVEAALSKIVVRVVDESVIERLVALGFVAAPGKEEKMMFLVTLNQSSKVMVFESCEMREFAFPRVQVGVLPTYLNS